MRRFPKPLNPGHRPFDGRDDQTMTNASVGAQPSNTVRVLMTKVGIWDKFTAKKQGAKADGAAS